MSSIFLKLVNMSVSAGWLILAVVAFRLVLRRTPKAIHCALWGLVALRLILPFHFESMFSLVPSAQTIPMNIAMEPRPAIDSGIAAIDQVVNPVLMQSLAPVELASANPLQIWIPVLTVIWLLGMAVMLSYALISYLRLCRRVRVSLRVEENVYLCDQVASPFILGILRPRIYFPSDMAEGEYRYVLAHERAPLRRRDNLWKPTGYLLLCVYWFNPLCWLAYILLCRDIELACDEKALRSLGVEQKKAYSRALLSCSVSRGSIAACPVAFGMVGVKQRVQAVLQYRKPAFWVVQVGILACILGAVCFLTDPVQAEEETAREHYEAYRQSFATGTAQETAELMWFPNEYVAEFFLENYYNEPIDTRKFEQINDELWVATNVGHLSDGEYEYYNFVARMDGGWKVIQDVRDIPEQLRTNLDSTLYDHHDDPDIMPRQPSELIQCYGELKKFAEPVKIEVDSSISDGKNPYPDEDYPYPPGSFLELVGSTDCWVADYSGTSVGGTPEQFIRLTNAEGNTLVIRPDVDVLEVFDGDGRCIASYVWEAWGERLPCGKEAYAFVSDWAAQKKAELESAARVEQSQYYGELKEFADPVKIEMDRPVAIDETPFPDENYLGDGSIEDLLETTGYWEADYSGAAVGGTPERYIRLTNAAGHTLVVRTDANELVVFDRDGRCIAAYSCPVKSGKELYSFLCRWATQRKAELESAAQIEYFGTPDCDEFINLRKEPDVSSESLLTIPLGTVFPVWKSENERFGVAEYGGAKGYVNLDYVTRLSDCTPEQLFRCAAYVHGPATTEAVTQELEERYRQNPDRFQAALSSMSLSGIDRFKGEESVRLLLASVGVTLETPKVTVLTRKTEDFEVDGLREETPENQERWREAMRTALWGAEAVERVDFASNGGVMVGVNGGYFDYCADGSFYYHDNGAYVIRGEAAQPLAALVQGVIEEKGVAPVRPQDLKGIRKASLVFGDKTIEVTDAATLAQIERALTQAKPISAPACWFTSLLTLELENGQSKTISIATDSCGVYHSDGTFFQFGHGNEDFYSLFGLTPSDISG